MEIRYFCQNQQCERLQKQPYELTLNIDDVMDENNIASMFCPYCKTKLESEKK